MRSKPPSIHDLIPQLHPLQKQNPLTRLLQPPMAKERTAAQPKRPKRDTQSLLSEIKALKEQSWEDKSRIMGCRFKLTEAEKKIKALEATQAKFQQIESTTVPLPLYTQILKKKIKDLAADKTEAEAQIQRLKKLPNSSIFEENDIEKSMLLFETVRLKAIIASLAGTPSEPISNQFLRIMKEENEKLKATIRILQNDKQLLKSKQSMDGKLTNDLKREIQQEKQRSTHFQAEYLRVKSQYNNILFKKTSQIQAEQNKKDSLEIYTLSNRVQQLEGALQAMEGERDSHLQDNQILKEKEKKLQEEYQQLQMRGEEEKKSFLDKIQLLHLQIQSLESNLVHTNTVKQRLRQKPTVRAQMRKPVGCEEVETAVLKPIAPLLAALVERQGELGCHELVDLVRVHLRLGKGLSVKVGKYLTEDNGGELVKYDEQGKVDVGMAVAVLRGLQSQVTNINVVQVEESIRNKVVDKKCSREAEIFRDRMVSKREIVQFFVRYCKGSLEKEEILHILRRTIALEESVEETILQGNRVIQFIQQVSRKE